MVNQVFTALQGEEIGKAKEALARELPVLRAKIGITQEELCQAIGITRQTYSLIETRKKAMSQSTYIALVLLFHYNDRTRDILERSGAFTDGLKAVCNFDGRR